MAKYINPHNWITSGVTKLSHVISDIDNFVLGEYRSVDIPENIKKHIQDAETHIKSAIIQYSTAARLLIEADAEVLQKDKLQDWKEKMED